MTCIPVFAVMGGSRNVSESKTIEFSCQSPEITLLRDSLTIEFFKYLLSQNIYPGNLKVSLKCKVEI